MLQFRSDWRTKNPGNASGPVTRGNAAATAAGADDNDEAPETYLAQRYVDGPYLVRVGHF